MQRLAGLLLVVTGAAFGAYAYLELSPTRVVEFAESSRIAAAPAHPRPSRDDSPVGTFSPVTPVFRELMSVEGTPAPAAPDTAKRSTWTTVVAAEQMEPMPLRSSKGNDPETRFELARDLQRELQRAGCYYGEITGVWSPATRRAMATFLDRANATLPVNEPDYVLLALIRGHNDIVCNADCPSGQVAYGSRCVPRAVVAQASKKWKRLNEQRLPEARLEGSTRQAVTSEPEKLPWLDRNGQSIIAQTDPRPNPPAGRMAIGGPVAGAGAPSGSMATPGSGWRQVTIETQVDDATRSPESKVADPSSATSRMTALTPHDGSDPDDPSTGATTDQKAVPLTAEEMQAREHKTGGTSRSARHSGSDTRPRPYDYASAGRTRPGQPRPGTIRYNLMQTLGGIY
jgi:hypothetical protein